MTFAKQIIWLVALFFLIYGLIFAIAPDAFALWVTGSAIQGVSAQVDFRATYGGLQLAFGALLALAARDTGTVRLGLWAVILSMSAMAITRTLGIVIDGQPNALMFVYLGLEILAILWGVFALRRLGPNLKTSSESPQ